MIWQDVLQIFVKHFHGIVNRLLLALLYHVDDMLFIFAKLRAFSGKLRVWENEGKLKVCWKVASFVKGKFRV